MARQRVRGLSGPIWPYTLVEPEDNVEPEFDEYGERIPDPEAEPDAWDAWDAKRQARIARREPATAATTAHPRGATVATPGGDLMPKVIVDDFTAGEAREVDVDWADMPLVAVVAMADGGDAEAQAWLDAHPVAETAHLHGQHDQKAHAHGGSGGAAAAAAGAVAEKARAAEPAISADMKAAVAGTPGELVGYEFRLKGKESLTRKIEGKIAEGQSPEQAAASIKDAVRYTVVAEPADYTKVYATARSRLTQKGYEEVEAKNYWDPGDAYSGLNTVWKSPGGEQTFEVQFHTPDSHALKEAQHTQYQEMRTETNPGRRDALYAAQTAAWDDVEVPVGAHGIGVKVVAPAAALAAVDAATRWFLLVDSAIGETEDRPGGMFRLRRDKDGLWTELLTVGGWEQVNELIDHLFGENDDHVEVDAETAARWESRFPWEGSRASLAVEPETASMRSRWAHLPGRHDQKAHAHGGLGKPLGGTGTADDPYQCGSDVVLAATMLGRGHHVTLDQPDEVSTLVGELGKIGQEAKAAGTKAKDYDLCRVSVPGTNLFCAENRGIARVDMPQLKGKAVPGSYADRKAKRAGTDEADIEPEFRQMLSDRGIAVTPSQVDPSHLRATQNELVGTKVGGMMRSIEAGTGAAITDPPIFVTRDNYVIDGHHRWAAIVSENLATGQGSLPMNVEVIDMDIGQAITMVNEFAGAMGIAPKSGTPGAAALAVLGASDGEVLMIATARVAHLPGKHNQRDHGSGVGGGKRRSPGQKAREEREQGIVERTRSEGGITIHPATGQEPSDGYIVARKEGTKIVPEAEFLGDRAKAVEHVDRYLADNADALSEPGAMLGVWHDKGHGEVVMDVVDHVADRGAAERLGRSNDQQAIWDVSNGAEIPTGGSGGREGSLDGGREAGRGVGEAAEAGERDDSGRTAGVRRAGRRRSAVEREGEVGRRLLARLSRLRRDAGRQMLAAAEVAFAEAMRAAGVRAINKARNKRGNSMAAAIGAAHADGEPLRPFFGTLSMTENELLAGAFVSFADQAKVWMADLRVAQREAMNQVDYPGDKAFPVESDEATAERAADYLASALLALARRRIVSGLDSTNLDGPGEVSGAIPARLIVQSLDVAEGSLMVTSGETPDDLPTVSPAVLASALDFTALPWFQRVGTLIAREELAKRLAEAGIADVTEPLQDEYGGEAFERSIGLTVEITEDHVFKGAVNDAIALVGDIVANEMTDATLYVWVHGFYGTPRTVFPPHSRLSGTVTSTPDNDEAFRNESGWPAVEFYRPGDHLGCTCELVPQVESETVEKIDTGVQGVLDRARQRIADQYGPDASDLRRIAPLARDRPDLDEYWLETFGKPRRRRR